MSLALEFEAKANHSKGGKEGSGQLHTTKEAAPVTLAPTTTPNFSQQPMTISAAEKQIRYAKGECFRCGEKFAPGHRCKTTSLHLLETERQNDIELLEEEERSARVAEISLHAILGLPHNTTLIVPGSINSSQVSVLVDCGSTHNFINDSLVSNIGLTTREVVPFGVRIGNGDLIRCHQVCKDVLLSLGDLKLTQDLYPFSLGGADVVLGIQWLSTLNTVLANWKAMFLKFTINGKEYMLQGKPPDGKQSATFRHFTIEPIGRGTAESLVRTATRLEDKSTFGVGCIDTYPHGVGGKAPIKKAEQEGKQESRREEGSLKREVV